MNIALKYFDLKKYLIGELGYSEFEAVHTISRLRKLEPELRNAFIKWFKTRELPELEYSGVTLLDVIRQTQQNTVAAFLSLDWVRREPDVAKHALSSFRDEVTISSDAADALRVQLNIAEPEPVDESDLESDVASQQ